MEIDPSFPAEPQPDEPASAHSPLNSFRQIIFQPGQAFAGIIGQEKKKTWLAPVILIVILVGIAALISTLAVSNNSTAQRISANGATRTSTQQARSSSNSTTNRSGQTQGGQAQAVPAQGGVAGGDFPGGLPPGANFGSPAVTGGTTTTQAGSTPAAAQAPNIWLSILMPVGSFLLTWLLLGGLTNLLSLAFGGRSNALMATNIAAWASIPIGVRNIMQIIYYLATGASIQQPGLSGFAPTPNGNTLLVFLQHLLSRVDLYLFWEMALLGIGVGIWGGLARKKSTTIALLAVGMIVLLQSLLGMGLELLGNVNINTGMLLRLR